VTWKRRAGRKKRMHKWERNEKGGPSVVIVWGKKKWGWSIPLTMLGSEGRGASLTDKGAKKVARNKGEAGSRKVVVCLIKHLDTAEVEAGQILGGNSTGFLEYRIQRRQRW